MQITFNLKSCIYVHLLNLMLHQAQIVAFGGDFAHQMKFVKASGNRTGAAQRGRTASVYLPIKSICADRYCSDLFERSSRATIGWPLHTIRSADID
jgi:hypothetical protein